MFILKVGYTHPQGKIAETIRLTRQFCVDMGCIGKHGEDKHRARINNEPKIAVAGERVRGRCVCECVCIPLTHSPPSRPEPSL